MLAHVVNTVDVSSNISSTEVTVDGRLNHSLPHMKGKRKTFMPVYRVEGKETKRDKRGEERQEYKLPFATK